MDQPDSSSLWPAIHQPASSSSSHQPTGTMHPPPFPPPHFPHLSAPYPALHPLASHYTHPQPLPHHLPALQQQQSDHPSSSTSVKYEHPQPPPVGPADADESSATPERSDGLDGKKDQRKALRRNMACHQCRRRKLKCDSLRPQCTPCSKARQSFIDSLPPGMEPPEMTSLCTYDEMNGPFKKNAGHGLNGSRRRSHSVDQSSGASGAAGGAAPSSGGGRKTNGKGHVIQEEREDEEESERRLELVELENAQLKAQLNRMHQQLMETPSSTGAHSRSESFSMAGGQMPQSSPTFLVSPQPYGGSPFEGGGVLTSPPYPHNPSQHLSASWAQTPPTTQALSSTLPPLLPPPPPLPRPRPDSHLHYPFINQQQQQQFLLPPIQPLSPGTEFTHSLIHPFDPRTGDVTSPLGDREGVIKAVGGLEALERAIRAVTTTAPLMRHVWPPYKTKYTSDVSSPNLQHSSPGSTASSSSLSTVSHTLLSRLTLPSSSPMRIHVSLILALSALYQRGTEDSMVWAIEAGREIVYCKLAGIHGEEVEMDARARERKALDVVQATTLLIALHHFEGRWTEFHNFAPLASLLCDLLGLEPQRPVTLPEYHVSALRRPNPAEDMYEERRRTVHCAKFVHQVYLCFSARGSWDIGTEIPLRPNEDVTSTPTLLSLQSIYLVSRVEKFNKTLRPPQATQPTNASLLQTIEDQVAFQLLEADVDEWCVRLGTIGPDHSTDWEGEYGMGELLGGKVLAEHARLLLYCVHLNNSSSDSQRRACLSAAQSISQSCVVASSIPPLAVPSFCLHSYFLAAQILLRFLASAQLNHDDWLIAQLSQQVSVIKHTFERLSSSYRIARNFYKLLETAMTEGSSVIPQSFAMVFDLAFYTPK